MKFKKKFTLGLVSSLCAFTLATCQSQSNDSAVATGDDIKITQGQLNDQMKKVAGDQTLRQLILSEISKQEVGKDRYKEIEQETDQQIAATKAQVGDNDKFQNVLKSSGVPSEEAYKESLIQYTLTQEALKKNIPVSDEELKKAYEDYEPAAEISHILVEDENEAKDIIKQLDQGGDFSALAKEHSKDPGSKEKGGSLGQVEKGQMVKEFEDAAFKLNEGEYTKEPVKSQYGYHVIKLDKKGQKGSFEDEKDKLAEQVKNKKMQDPSTLLQVTSDLLKKYNIDIKDSDLKSALDQFKPKEEDKKADKNSKEESKDQDKKEENKDDQKQGQKEQDNSQSQSESDKK
ncbi:peptidylprolyl isomerase [Aerococcus urinae]|uniref:peptidylprolyl isomerase n=1 Tax=Aerococcus urinae TaxID=1376 RepID=UPI0018E12D48|nr:peptidylprolyl isomerase [Aerococcus urinae]